jgi:uncharacterized protein YbaR (Trm112 family)
MRGRLPDDILDRKKQGFAVPVARWMREDLAPALRDELAPDKLRREGLFDPAFVEGLVAITCRAGATGARPLDLVHVRALARALGIGAKMTPSSQWFSMLPLDLLCCPVTHKPLRVDGPDLVADDGHRYRIDGSGVPLFAETGLSTDADRQREHYQRIAASYVENINYPHTEEYNAYLDRVFLDAFTGLALETVAELCCGQGEAATLLGPRVGRGIGVDISPAMLEAAVRGHADSRFAFVQGDATQLPLRDGRL